jgi:YgiT-type zinc finger domain-containing protein
MKCVICRSGETRPGTMTVMLELGANGAVAVIRSVPAERCVSCGEGYLTEKPPSASRRLPRNSGRPESSSRFASTRPPRDGRGQGARLVVPTQIADEWTTASEPEVA